MEQIKTNLYAVVYAIDNKAGSDYVQTFLESDDERMIAYVEDWVIHNPEILKCDLHLVGTLKQGVKGKLIKSIKPIKETKENDEIKQV